MNTRFWINDSPITEALPFGADTWAVVDEAHGGDILYCHKDLAPRLLAALTAHDATAGAPMTQYQVSVQRTIEVTVTVDADSPEAARELVMRADFELPPRDQWNGQKDWEAAVYDPDGNVLIGYDDDTDDERPINTSHTMIARQNPETAARVILRAMEGGGDVLNAWLVLEAAVGHARTVEYVKEESVKAGDLTLAQRVFDIVAASHIQPSPRPRYRG